MDNLFIFSTTVDMIHMSACPGAGRSRGRRKHYSRSHPGVAHAIETAQFQEQKIFFLSDLSAWQTGSAEELGLGDIL